MTVFHLTSTDDRFPQSGQDVDGDDTIYGLAGNDRLKGGLGNDNVYGGAGNDTLFSDWTDHIATGADLLGGGDGDDVILALGYETETGFELPDDTLLGGDGNDTLYGGVSIWGGAGDDSIQADEGSQRIGGGLGNDRIYAGYLGVVPKVVTGDQGQDFLATSVIRNWLPDDAGSVSLSLDGKVRIDGVVWLEFSGFEEVSFSTNAKAADLQGGAERNYFTVSGLAATVSVGDGQDVVTVGYGAGTDGGVYTLDGGAGEDTLRVYAMLQDDGPAIYLDWAAGLARFGGTGDSHFTGFEVLDLLGSAGNDTVIGGRGNDLIDGSFGNDRLNGDDLDDTLEGGFGADTLAGGAGQDVFVYQSVNDSGVKLGEIDNIFSFKLATRGNGFVDRIDLSPLDGIRATAADDPMAFIGQAAFSGEGQVRVQQVGSGTFVLINLDADLDAEMRIALPRIDAADIQAVDFIL